MPSRRASTIACCATALGAALAALTGCASGGFSSGAPPGEHLAGDWKLDPARSDDLGQAVAELRAQSARAHHPVRGGEIPRASAVDELMTNLPRGDYLKIAVSTEAFTVTSGDASAQYTPGLESEISAQQGDAQQISGWKGAAYVIDTKPQFGPEIIQTFALTKDGRLSLTVRLSGGGTQFTFNRLYERTTRVAPLAPPTTN